MHESRNRQGMHCDMRWETRGEERFGLSAVRLGSTCNEDSHGGELLSPCSQHRRRLHATKPDQYGRILSSSTWILSSSTRIIEGRPAVGALTHPTRCSPGRAAGEVDSPSPEGPVESQPTQPVHDAAVRHTAPPAAVPTIRLRLSSSHFSAAAFTR